MKPFKHLAVLALASAASLACAATQPISAVTSSVITLDTAALATNSFTASAVGGSTYNSGTGVLTDSVSSVSTLANPGAAVVQYDPNSGLNLKTSIAFVGTVNVALTDLVYNAQDNTLYSDMVVTALGSTTTYANQAILVAGNEVGSLGGNSLDHVTLSASPLALNYSLTSFTLATDLSTKLGNLVSFVSWLPGAVKNVTVTSAVTPAVPEPSTYALLSIGLVGMAVVSRRKLNNQN